MKRLKVAGSAWLITGKNSLQFDQHLACGTLSRDLQIVYSVFLAIQNFRAEPLDRINKPVKGLSREK